MSANEFGQTLRAALSSRPRSISPKFFYDAAGSRLFDRICDLPEYYLTRTEFGLLADHAGEIASLIGAQAEIVEFGAGSATKIRLLLDALREPRCYVPVDISADHLHAACTPLGTAYPGLAVTPLAADFTQPLALPSATPRVGFFAGSSIGNFTPQEAENFLRNAAHSLHGGALLIGVDLIKDPALLHRAYNDAAGVTAAFNRNLLVRANRELHTDFVPQRFAHYAFYEPRWQRIEMHLVSLMRQSVRLGGECFEFDDGDNLHTENSYKYSIEGFHALARRAGWRAQRVWSDARAFFSLHWLTCR